MKKFLAVSLIPFALAACGQPVDPDAPQPIRIGAILPLTGPTAAWGEDAARAIEFAQDELEGKLSRPIEILTQNDETKPMGAVTAFRFLHDAKKIDGVFGGVWDFNYAPIAPIVTNYKVPMVSPNPSQPGDEVSPFVFRAGSPLRDWFSPFQNLIADRGWKKIAILRFASTFADTMEAEIQAGADKSGAKITHRFVTSALQGNDLKNEVLLLKEKIKPDVIFIDLIDTDVSELFRRAREIEYDLPPVVSHGMLREVFERGLVQPAEAEKMIFSEVELSDDFLKKWREKFGTENPPKGFAEPAVKGFEALAIALDRADGDGPRAAEILASEEFPGGVKFDENHDFADQKIVLKTIRDGKIVPLEN